MNIGLLNPTPDHKQLFELRTQKFVPVESGCYVLASLDGTVLYVGLAKNLRNRMSQHLANPSKRSSTVDGRAMWFHWLICAELQKIERTWMNIHLNAEGRLPVLNSVYSPI